jgi:GTP-binding protein
MKATSPQPFIDHLTLKVASGHGGAGASSYRREYKVARGGPDGGDGGKGGDVYVKGDSRKHTLLDYRYKRIYTAQNGEPGRGSRCFGKSGEDEILYLPLGTQVFNAETGELICDVLEEKTYKILEGGKGGLGNWHFKNSKNQAPSYAQKGLPGEELDLRLELKLIADMGLVGFPNAGKSTLLTLLSNAKTKVGAYPFTTLNPQLGVLRHKSQEVVIADLPGLIEGASKGVGLGHKFLKHVERTQKILHLVSLDPSEAQEPMERYSSIRKELKDYDLGVVDLIGLEEIVVLTKSDLTHPQEVDQQIKNFEECGLKVIVISSVTNRNIDSLKDVLIESNIKHKMTEVEE